MARLRTPMVPGPAERPDPAAGTDGAPIQWWDVLVPDTEVVPLDRHVIDQPGAAMQARLLLAHARYRAAYETWADDLYETTGRSAPQRPPWRPRRRHPWPHPDDLPLPTRARNP